ncbi:MAG: undecaprenyldiphospho-muramoylpentapeptide beta-N-acetylglucosaminyltransferase [Desulfuromonadales bacterium GWD2_61_12]|nr:MAG: undecaprenyldiphospho-muramoylpentapeptide beta-N-acetylglucosaminyltransferase [Desulfuromonadales bacterium GWC2_61_20]OGR32789.1 MAG: undecaprenyldiphospho-muramoylpentapeptide beta-N-acetylglucosaminyltransferase [Desulfuromonadales bacterium GWD2_61_12]HAD04758.1 undecaprenyldiphospho-muramoylpentapeptide beta-N-acetylglucosaminyltransferase [Desulfuromonas sp.]HBT81909.1 undecaprenyldiphospho-muramoylpentapeptide beta-N-acetylglucosaminyltransferase [Desulfuromonas sp.]
MRILLAGGGTGGHLFPAVALAQKFLAEEWRAEVLFVGTDRGIEARVLPELGLPLRTIDIEGFVGRGLGEKLAVLPQLARSVRQSLTILDDFRPDLVIGVGGYASAPVLLAAKWRGLPYLIHEQNAWPGLTNRLLARWAERICLSFAEAESAFHTGATIVTGNPVRAGMTECPGLAEGAAQLLIFGGSRGARAINNAVIEALPFLASLRGKLGIVHQTGSDDHERIAAGYRSAGWDEAKVVPFINDMAAAYRRSHLVLCRAGATTIAELTACGRPAVLVPFPFAAGDHQSANARALARQGAALLLEQKGMTGEVLGQLLAGLLDDRPRLLQMADIARSLGKPQAAEVILKECRTILERV